MTIHLEEECGLDLPFDYKKLLETVIRKALDYERFPFEAEVSVTLVDLDRMHQINREYRQIDRPTDVLSFPFIDYPAPGDFSEIEKTDDFFNPDSGEAVLGDIVLCIPRLIAQAQDYGHSTRREFAFLIAHSMLHLMGYDHMTDAERIDMERRQSEMLDQLGIHR